MSFALRGLPPDWNIAIFDEPNQTGAVHDLDASRNGPAKTPAAHLDKLYFHTILDLLEVAAEASVNIAHDEIAAGSGTTPGGGVSMTGVFQWGGVTDDQLLLDLTSFGFSQPPFCLVVLGDDILFPGMQVQTDSGGRGRYVTPYVTTTAVRLFETASRTSSPLAGTTLAYKVLAFFDPPAPSTNELMAFDPNTGEFNMGLGRFSSLARYLQVALGGSPFGLSTGRTIDLKNGAPRFVRSGGAIFDPVPDAGVKMGPGNNVDGASLAYNGTFTGDGAVEVQAP